jgi:hypothetical protein
VVGGADADPQRHRQRGHAAPERALVEQAEQRVEDRGRAQEHLVEERDLGVGQHPGDLGLDHAVAQPPQIDRPDDLAGLGEPPEQVLEVAPAERARHPPHRLALRGARRPEHEQVLAGDRRERDQIDQDVAIDQAARRRAERGPDRARSGFDRRGHDLIIACRSHRLPRRGRERRAVRQHLRGTASHGRADR